MHEVVSSAVRNAVSAVTTIYTRYPLISSLLNSLPLRGEGAYGSPLLADLRTLLVGQRIAVLVGLVALHDLHVVVQLEGGLFEQRLLRQLVLLVADFMS